MKKIDMHIHTTASDGELTPKEAVDYAIKIGLSGIAITDHDTVEGIQEAVEYGRAKGILVIPGIELSTEENEEEIHILGYYIDYHAKELLDLLGMLKNEREKRIKEIVKRLNSNNIHVEYDEVMRQSKDGVVGRPHIAKVLMERGYVKDIASAFPLYLNKGCPAYVPRFKLKPCTAIELIKKMNGFAIIAHPGVIRNEILLKKYIEAGLDGIEVYHPLHDEATEVYLKKLAEDNKLIVTGGSDFHYLPREGEILANDRYCISLSSIKEIIR